MILPHIFLLIPISLAVEDAVSLYTFDISELMQDDSSSAMANIIMNAGLTSASQVYFSFISSYLLLIYSLVIKKNRFYFFSSNLFNIRSWSIEEISFRRILSMIRIFA